VGLCHQHVHELDVSLDVNTREDVLRLRDLVDSGHVHIAPQFTAVAVAALGRMEYSRRIIAGHPHCKHGSGAQQLQLIKAYTDLWFSEDGPHLKYGPHATFVCDGASFLRCTCVRTAL
jgi:hypothetical protein